MSLRVAAITVALLATHALTHAEELSPPCNLPKPPDGQTWRLAWHDEFNGTAFDTAKWEVIGDVPRRKAFWAKDDAYLDGNGRLILRTKQDGERYTSGAIRTRGLFEHCFGYWEIRCSFHAQEGHWPAFWIHSDTVGTVGNDGHDGTEIDIMEKPWLTDQIQHALHWDGYGEHHKSAGQRVERPGLSAGFHTFGLLWTRDEYVFYVDGDETWRTSAGGVCQVPSYIKITEEIDTWAGDIAQAKLPDYFTVDYVRVFDAIDAPPEPQR